MEHMPRKHHDAHAHFVHVPGKRLMHAVPLKYVWNRVTGASKKGVNASINMVPFIDTLLITVIFLLMTFSASGQMSVPDDIDLPQAENAIAVIDAPVVQVSGKQVFVDGSLAGSTRAIAELGRMQKIDELFNLLKAKRELWKQVQPNDPFPGVVILQIDDDVEALVVKSVFQTAAFAGYPNVSFMVGKLPASDLPAPKE